MLGIKLRYYGLFFAEEYYWYCINFLCVDERSGVSAAVCRDGLLQTDNMIDIPDGLGSAPTTLLHMAAVVVPV